ncbi:MAG TPA: homocysteine S-methyltransferase [Candidatus Limnocylindrales bacterium]|nr:homocysteine S-methyltransferase [Candidatus Limnocylindrales bacterium]
MDSTAFRSALDASEVIVLDGGLATQLEAQGADLSDALWSARLLADAPGEIVAAHAAYYRAGARVATTASYQATFEGFARRGIAHEEAAALLRRSVELAAEARETVGAERAGTAARLFVAASIGPYGAMLADGAEYRGRYGRSVGQLRDFHRGRLEVLAGTDADVLAVETIPELEEAVAVAGLVAETEEAAAWLSFSCVDGARIRSGAPIEEAVAAVDGTRGLLAIGVNCTAPQHVDELLGRIAATTALPIVVYPNRGEGWDAARRAWTGAAAGRIDAAAGRRWLAAGARLIGGCCRVTPDQVHGLAVGLPAHAPAAQ